MRTTDILRTLHLLSMYMVYLSIYLGLFKFLWNVLQFSAQNSCMSFINPFLSILQFQNSVLKGQKVLFYFYCQLIEMQQIMHIDNVPLQNLFILVVILQNIQHFLYKPSCYMQIKTNFISSFPICMLFYSFKVKTICKKLNIFNAYNLIYFHIHIKPKGITTIKIYIHYVHYTKVSSCHYMHPPFYHSSSKCHLFLLLILFPWLEIQITNIRNKRGTSLQILQILKR